MRARGPVSGGALMIDPWNRDNCGERPQWRVGSHAGLPGSRGVGKDDEPEPMTPGEFHAVGGRGVTQVGGGE